MTTLPLANVVAIMPAWNEEGSIAAVIRALYARGVGQVIVGDNASSDATAAVAHAAGAVVVPVARRGYGSACQGALAALPAWCQAVVFCDADGADDLNQLPRLLAPVLRDQADLVVGSRARGVVAEGALSTPQRLGNLLCTVLMRLLYRARVSDLGPFRCIKRSALDLLQMRDPTFGWTTEMQTKAFRAGLRYREVPVNALLRTAGESKISGNLRVCVIAGWVILRTIAQHLTWTQSTTRKETVHAASA